MKKINQAKWDAIQQKKTTLHNIYLSIAADWDHAHQQYGRAVAFFAHSYPDLNTAHALILRDARTLSAADIRVKIDQMRTDWPAACIEFNVAEGFYGKPALINVYSLMLDRKKLTDARDQAAHNQQSFGACFEALSAFAAERGQGRQSSINVVPDQGPVYGGYEGY